MLTKVLIHKKIFYFLCPEIWKNFLGILLCITDKGVYVGFLKFLKREKEESLDELDLPPAPPPLEGIEEGTEFPAFPDFEENKQKSKISGAPKISDFHEISVKDEMPSFDFPEEEKIPDFGKQEDMQFPGFPEMEQEPVTDIPNIMAPADIPEPEQTTFQPMPELKQEVREDKPMTDDFPRIGRRLFRQEKRLANEISHRKETYVRVDRFRATLQNIGMIKGNLRKSEEILIKLENIKNAKDMSFDKVKSSLDDLQRKLIFVDKTLFKGE